MAADPAARAVRRIGVQQAQRVPVDRLAVAESRNRIGVLKPKRPQQQALRFQCVLDFVIPQDNHPPDRFSISINSMRRKVNKMGGSRPRAKTGPGSLAKTAAA